MDEQTPIERAALASDAPPTSHERSRPMADQTDYEAEFARLIQSRVIGGMNGQGDIYEVDAPRQDWPCQWSFDFEGEDGSGRPVSGTVRVTWAEGD